MSVADRRRGAGSGIVARIRDHAGSSSLEVLTLGVLVLALVIGVGTFVALQSLDRGPASSGGSSPTRFVPSGAAVDTLRIACGHAETFVDADAVNARPAGVRIGVDGAPGQRISFWSTGGAEYAFEMRAASTTAAVPLPPGTWSVACSPVGEIATDPALGTPFVIADPSGAYVRTGPDCDAGSQHDASGALASWTGDDPETALRDALGGHGVSPTDAVERAGYPTARIREDPPVSWVFRVTRGTDEQIVAVVDVTSGADGWSYHIRACADGT
jgi:hypothetical protein